MGNIWSFGLYSEDALNGKGYGIVEVEQLFFYDRFKKKSRIDPNDWRLLRLYDHVPDYIQKGGMSSLFAYNDKRLSVREILQTYHPRMALTIDNHLCESFNALSKLTRERNDEEFQIHLDAIKRAKERRKEQHKEQHKEQPKEQHKEHPAMNDSI